MNTFNFRMAIGQQRTQGPERTQRILGWQWMDEGTQWPQGMGAEEEEEDQGPSLST